MSSRSSSAWILPSTRQGINRAPQLPPCSWLRSRAVAEMVQECLQCVVWLPDSPDSGRVHSDADGRKAQRRGRCQGVLATLRRWAAAMLRPGWILSTGLVVENARPRMAEKLVHDPGAVVGDGAALVYLFARPESMATSSAAAGSGSGSGPSSSSTRGQKDVEAARLQVQTPRRVVPPSLHVLGTLAVKVRGHSVPVGAATKASD